jgi:hypothetical protein
MAPALTPEIIPGFIPFSSSAFKTPRWAKPRAAPPLRTSPLWYSRDFPFEKIFFISELIKRIIYLDQYYKV